MKKPLLNVLFFLVPIFIFSVLNLVFHGGATVSSLEQREIQQLPVLTYQSLAENTFTKDFDRYFSDNFIFRTSFLETGSWIKGLKGAVGNDVKLVANKGGNNASQHLAPKVPDEVEGNSTVEEPEVDVQQAEAETYLIVKDRAMSLYHYYPESAAAYADAINKLQSAVSPEIRVYALLAPSSVEFIVAEKYRSMSDSQKEAFEYVARHYNGNIHHVPAYDKLYEHRNEYIYYRTDHHWTSLGAYYAYEALMETMGQEPVSLARYDKVEIPDFLGSSYAATLSTELKNNPDTITVYKPFVEYKNNVYWDEVTPSPREVVELALPEDGRGGYAVFMGGDYPLDKIETDVNNGKRLLLIKDSYANALIPFLLPHFESITIVDPRYYSGNLVELAEKEKTTDILAINSSIVTTYAGIADMIREKL